MNIMLQLASSEVSSLAITWGSTRLRSQEDCCHSLYFLTIHSRGAFWVAAQPSVCSFTHFITFGSSLQNYQRCYSKIRFEALTFISTIFQEPLHINFVGRGLLLVNGLTFLVLKLFETILHWWTIFFSFHSVIQTCSVSEFTREGAGQHQNPSTLVYHKFQQYYSSIL